MGTVQGLTKERMLEIEAASVVAGYVDGAGDLILTTHDGEESNAGSVRAPNHAVASTTVQGIVELATGAETHAGSDATRAVTPNSLLTALKGDILPANTDLNTLVNTRNWIVQVNPSAHQNWPGQGIPTAYTADANNPQGSYISPQAGTLRVHNDGVYIRQDAETTIGGSMNQTLHFSRVSLDGGTTWGVWRMTDGALSAVGASEQYYLGLYSKPNRRNVISLLRGDFTVPYSVQTFDGVQYVRDVTATRQTTPNWVTVPLIAPVVPYAAANWYPPQVIRTSAGIIKVRGLAKANGITLPNGTQIGTLPQGYRPAQSMMFSAPSVDATQGSLISVDIDGAIRYQGSNSANPMNYVSFNSIIFPAADVAPANAWTPLTISGSWTVYGGASSGFGQPGYWQDSLGRVWLRGMLGHPGIPSGVDVAMASVPVALKTNQQIHSIAPAWTSTLGVSVHWLNGIITYKVSNPTGAIAWVSLAQMFMHPVASIPEASWRNMSLTAPWGNYGTASFPPASVWSAADGIQHVRGLVSGGSAGSQLSAAMGVNDRCISSEMYITSANNAAARWNINDSVANAVTVTAGSGAWLSLDGGHYFLEG